MKKLKYSLLTSLCLAAMSCHSSEEESAVKVTSVAHSPVKRQSIGNCWLYAQSTWLESMLKTTTGANVNVSETYWTYWDMYHKLLRNQPIPEEELNTGGTWGLSKSIILEYGWVKEDDFIPEEKNKMMSESQACAEDYILAQGREGGTLFAQERTPELLRAELDKAFSCNGKYKFDMNAAFANRQKAEDTQLIDVKTKQERSLKDWLSRWTEASVATTNSWGPYEGKKIPTESEVGAYKQIEQRIKKALNDHQPVVLSWFVSFNAANKTGLFNISSLADKGELGSSGGHMIVLYDYTVKNVPNKGSLGEGDLSEADKALALQGDLDYLVVKNSWGADRPDRPWLRDGYSRLSWDYLSARYENESGTYSPFIRGVVFPPGY
ncbi:MAG: hypothetical protein EOP10_00650 [Proteobacteria bacterium]|nr:MAG: hypothetical protein EOP10_00650 [Pseudomonadota bacterium]